MLPVEIFYAKIPNLALNIAAKEKPQLAVIISANPKWQAKQTEKEPLLFSILHCPFILCKNCNKYMTRCRNRMPVPFLTYSRPLIIPKNNKIVSTL